MKNISALFLIFINLLWFTSSAHALDVEKSSGLSGDIIAMDKVFFDAFNAQDLEKLKTLFSKDLEFYHDKGGVFNYEKNIEATKKLFENNKTLKRELIKGSSQVFPIKDYGAIQTGEHKFCHVENGKNDCGVFKFTHIWKKTDGTWQLARVISYDH